MRRQRDLALVFTCEHGGNHVPAAFRDAFARHRAMLASHRGYDPGALSLAQAFARSFDAPLVASRVSRLVVELNRSPGNPDLFSPPMRESGRDTCTRAFRTHYLPYHHAVRHMIATSRARGKQVLHVSVHTFTPVLDGRSRRAHVGLLYDPARSSERRLCAEWQAALQAAGPGLRVRRNYPYRGTSDGLTTTLRRKWPASRYAGVELEVNQALYFAGQATWTRARRSMVVALREAIERLEQAR